MSTSSHPRFVNGPPVYICGRPSSSSALPQPMFITRPTVASSRYDFISVLAYFLDLCLSGLRKALSLASSTSFRLGCHPSLAAPRIYSFSIVSTFWERLLHLTSSWSRTFPCIPLVSLPASSTLSSSLDRVPSRPLLRSSLSSLLSHPQASISSARRLAHTFVPSAHLATILVLSSSRTPFRFHHLTADILRSSSSSHLNTWSLASSCLRLTLRLFCCSADHISPRRFLGRIQAVIAGYNCSTSFAPPTKVDELCGGSCSRTDLL
ncbi:hypothetical protein DAEQUDRAFT_733348 [Daedalea quercina L-15889]|uniref:Uncharacterized protein n=1 Tax=Daedalea quercina L-15889 TaxID=1314783 RepID=A0A165L1A6_9APHY|nr:hypothetical protein DAEQUDRAFT_733348 [Daedalea quercina L-15889]